MGKYAKETTTTIANSELELKRTLRRYNVERIASFTEPGVASVVFEKDGTPVRFTLVVPPLESFLPADLTESQRTSDYYMKPAMQKARKAWEQEERRIWRVLIMVVKAHFELAEEIGFDQAFTSHVVTPSGETVAEWLLPKMDELRAAGRMPDPFEGLTSRRVLPSPND